MTGSHPVKLEVEEVEGVEVLNFQRGALVTSCDSSRFLSRTSHLLSGENNRGGKEELAGGEGGDGAGECGAGGICADVISVGACPGLQRGEENGGEVSRVAMSRGVI